MNRVEESGPSSRRRFVAKAIRSGVVVGTGEGTTKKEAINLASQRALEDLARAGDQ